MIGPVHGYRWLCYTMLTGLAATDAVDGEVHPPSAPAEPAVHAPSPRALIHEFDLKPLPSTHLPGFANPFRQYEGGSIPGWAYGWDTTLFNDYLSLTPAAAHKTGYAWMSSPITLSGGWEVEFDFHVGGAMTRGKGGGLAFWWTAEPAKPGPIYGHTDSFKGLVVYFDTYEPTGGDSGLGDTEPYIAAVVNDGKRSHCALQWRCYTAVHPGAVPLGRIAGRRRPCRNIS